MICFPFKRSSRVRFHVAVIRMLLGATGIAPMACMSPTHGFAISQAAARLKGGRKRNSGSMKSFLKKGGHSRRSATSRATQG